MGEMTVQTPPPGPSDRLDGIFAALSDPTRRAMLARLAVGEATVTELAAPFDLSLPAVSKHLKVLRRAGLVEQGREAQRRPCRLRAEPLRDVAGWLARYGEILDERYDRLDRYLRSIQDTGKEHDDGDPTAR